MLFIEVICISSFVFHDIIYLSYFVLFSIVCRELPYEFGPRREGDIAVCYADPHK